MSAERGRSDRSAMAGSVLAGVAIQAVIVLSGVLAARLLGVTDRGHLALLWLVAIVLAQLASLGVPASVTYYVAEGKTGGGAMLRSVRRLAAVQLAAMLAIHAALLWLMNHDETGRVQLAAALTLVPMPALLAHQYGLGVLQGRQRFRLYNLQRAMPLLLYSVVLGGAFVVGAGDLVAVTAIWAGSTTVGAGATLFLAWADLRRDGADRPGPAPSSRDSLRFGLRSLLGTFTGFEHLQLDQAIVGLALSTYALGLYVVAVAFSNLPRLVGQSIGIVAFPAVARADGEGRTRHALLRFFLAGAVISSAVVAALWVLIPSVLPLFFGPEFREAVPVAQILLLAALCQSTRRVLSDGARGAGYPLLGTIAELSSWAVVLPAVVLLAPAHGLSGVAIALCLASATSLAIVGLGLPVLAAQRQRKRPVVGQGPEVPYASATAGLIEPQPPADAVALDRAP